jgi:hypothetical protein
VQIHGTVHSECFFFYCITIEHLENVDIMYLVFLTITLSIVLYSVFFLLSGDARYSYPLLLDTCDGVIFVPSVLKTFGTVLSASAECKGKLF